MGGSLNISRGSLLLLAWVGLWVAESVVSRAVQPTIFMSFLAIGTLTLASAALLSVSSAFSRRQSKFALRMFVLLGAASGLGLSAALVIRGLYLWLYPNVRPFGLAFNIATDIGGVTVHAMVVGCTPWLLRRKG